MIENDILQNKLDLIAKTNDGDLFKSFSSDLKSRFPDGKWVTMNGSHVFINGKTVIAGLDSMNKTIDEALSKEKTPKQTKPQTVIVNRGLSKDWKKTINDWLDKVPSDAHPTVMGTFATYKKATDRNFNDVRNWKSKFGVTVEGRNVKIPKGDIPDHILAKMRSEKAINERVYEIAKDITVVDKIWEDSVVVVGLNSVTYKDAKDFEKRKLDINDRYEKENGKKYFLNTTMQGTFVHELGHVLDKRRNITSNSKWSDVWSKWKREKDTPDLVNGSASEAFAEAFSNYHTEKGKDLPKYIHDFVNEEVGKKSVRLPEHLRKLL